eukprot:jgi/Ulvmu1/2887/UM146_0029.1
MIKALLQAAFICAMAMGAFASDLNIETTYMPSTCDRKAAPGDQVKVHYSGKLADGTKFDASYDRGQPLPFKLGAGQVISGWDQGIQGMCEGEKRTLTIPPELGYGDAGAGGVIPPKATLIFETELVAIQ